MHSNFLDTFIYTGIIGFGALPQRNRINRRENRIHMKRYIDLQNAAWADKTASRIREAKREACLAAFGSEAPCAGVIDTQPMEMLEALIAAGWTVVSSAPGDLLRRKAARRAVMDSLADDADCLSPEEHTLVERMLIGDGAAFPETAKEMEAALTLRLRLWCDVGLCGGRPCARLDGALLDALPGVMMRPMHHDRRSRVFIFQGMIGALLYLTGFLDSRMPRERFIAEVLGASPTPETLRLARNHLEASFDMIALEDCSLLLHEALAQPEQLVRTLSAYGAAALPDFGSNKLMGAMNGLLPEEASLESRLKRALRGALRPELDVGDAAEDLRLLVKQGAPASGVREALCAMLCVTPGTELSALTDELCRATPGWLPPFGASAQGAGGAAAGVIH